MEPDGKLDSPTVRSTLESVRRLLAGVDPLLIATVLAVASLTPGPAGEAGAVAAIGYDIKHKRWYGVVLSAASMIPVFGYIPAFFKVGLLLFLLNHDLKTLEAELPDIHSSPEVTSMVQSSLDRYNRKLPDIWLTRPLRKRLGRIMGLQEPGHSVPSTPSESASEDTSISAQIPE